jgi:FkbM family methyltransferase
MGAPRFSVVIPTRERADTLRFTLRTCLAQDFDDFEIVVGDNCGSSATRKVVEEAASDRIRHVRSPKLLSMSSNWDFALSHARGEYVLVLGDDDGLLSHALRELDRLITRLRPQALRWTGVYYSWPTIDLPGQADYLRIPLGREVRTVEALPAIAAAVRFEACYSTLPMLYNSAIHRDLIARLRERAGRVFANHYPDVYSGFALGYLAGTYVSLDLPMTIAGTSGGSFGVANLFHRGKSARDHEFRSLNAQERLPMHPWVPDLAIFPFVPVADSFLIARAALFPAEERLQLDRRAFAAHCVHAIRADDEGGWREALARIRGTFADDPESQAWFDATLGHFPFRPASPVQLRSPYLGPDGDYLHLSAEAFGITDVHGAAQLCEKLLGCQGDDLRYGLQPRSRLEALCAAARAELAEARAQAARLREELERARGPLLARPPFRGPAPARALPGAHRKEGRMSPADHLAQLQAAELRAFQALTRHLPTRTMIDVGAHHGSTLGPFLEAGWRVWAFEPIEANRARLLARAGAGERLTVRPEAVSDSSGTGQLQLALNLDGSLHDYYHSLERTRADRYHRKGAAVDVPVVSLDDLAARGEVPAEVGFLKVDTEGHDLAVLRGASSLRCAVVGVEFWGDHHPLGRSPSPAPDMIALMASRGYDTYLVLCHQGGETYVLGSTFTGVQPDAWGNILFFHPAQRALQAALLRELGRPIPAAPPGLPGCGRGLGDETEALLEQSRVLQQECDDRLRTIEGLKAVADERLELIQVMAAETERVRAAAREREELLHTLDTALRTAQATAEDRLAIIQNLERDLRCVQGVAEEREAIVHTPEGALREARDAARALAEDLRRARAVAEERLAVIGSQAVEIQRLVAAEQARLLAKLRRAVGRALPAPARALARRLLGRDGRSAG